MVFNQFASSDELYSKLKLSIPEIEIQKFISQKENFKIIDCREVDETSSGTIPNAILMPKGRIDLEIEKIIKDRNQSLVFFCASGRRSLFGAAVAKSLGYQNVFSLAGGIKQWKDLGHLLTEPQQTQAGIGNRYEAQIKLDEFGTEGQQKLTNAKVLIVGAGGLGSPIALYLAAAGVGQLTLIDDDSVDTSNLQRQILHSTSSLGVAKVASAKMVLQNLNPHIEVIALKMRLNELNVDSIFKNVDIVVDGSDNFNTKYLVNDACVKNNKVLIQASVFQLSGQISVFNLNSGPCFKCLFPVPAEKELAPNCAEGGVLGVIPGILGSMAALEVIKILTSIGNSLSGRLVRFDGLDLSFQELVFSKDKNCPCCSVDPSSIKYQNLDKCQV